MTLTTSLRARLLVTQHAPNPLADNDATARYAEAVIQNDHDLDQLHGLVERTNRREMIETFRTTVPGADQQRLAGAITVLDVMED